MSENMNKTNEKKLKLSPPWRTYLNEITEMFGEDMDIKILFDEEEMEIKLLVDSSAKAEALERILNPEVTFGNVTLKITVVPPNKNNVPDVLDDFLAAFLGNPALIGTLPIESPLGMHRFVIFQKKVVQFYNDQLDDPHGNKSTLLQEIAKDIFRNELSVNFCTERKGDTLSVGKPLGEWP